MVLDMERKLRMISGSLVVTIPSQIAELYGMAAGDILKIEQGGPGELRLKKREHDFQLLSMKNPR